MTDTVSLRRRRSTAVLAAWVVLLVSLPLAGGLAAPASPAAGDEGDPFTMGLRASYWPFVMAPESATVTVERRSDPDEPWVAHEMSPATLHRLAPAVPIELTRGDHVRLSRLGELNDVEPYRLVWICANQPMPTTDGGRTIEVDTSDMSGPGLPDCYLFHDAQQLDVLVTLEPGMADPGVPFDLEVTRQLVHSPGVAVDHLQVPADGRVTTLVPQPFWTGSYPDQEWVPREFMIAPTTPGLETRHQCFFEGGENAKYQILPEEEGAWGEGPVKLSASPPMEPVTLCHLELYEPDAGMVGEAAITSVVTEKGGPSTVELAWGELDDAESRVEVWRDGVRLAELPSTARHHTDSIDGAGPHEYQVVAQTTSGPEVIGAPHLAIPDDHRECSILWTGAVGSEWTEPSNWAPYAFDAGHPGPVRFPMAEDHACIDVEQSLPVVTQGPDLRPVSQLTGTVTDVVALTAAQSRLRVLRDLALPAVVIHGGALQVDGAAKLSSKTLPSLTFRNGTLELGGDLLAEGTIEAVPHGRGTIAADGTITGTELRLGEWSFLEAQGGFDLLVDSTIAGDQSELSYGYQTVPPVLHTSSLEVDYWSSWWGLTGRDELSLTVAPGGHAYLWDLVDLRNGSTWPNGHIELGGYLTTNGRRLESIPGSLTLNGPDAMISDHWSVPDGVMGSLNDVGELVVTGGSDTASIGPLSVDRLRIDDGALTVPDELTVDDEVHLAGSARLAVAPGWKAHGPEVLRVTGDDNVIEGDLYLDGGARLEVVEEVGTPPGHGRLDVDRLTVATDGEVRVGVDATGNGRVVAGDLDISGRFVAVVGDTLDDVLKVALLSGTDGFHFTGTTVLEAAPGSHPSVLEGVALEVANDGIWLTTDATVPPPPECETPPGVLTLIVTGCWELMAEGLYRTSVEQADEAGVDATIDGVTVRPSPGVDLFLDTKGILDATDRATGGVGTVAFSTTLTGQGWETPLPLGTVPVDEWPFVVADDPGLELDLDHLVGLPLSGAPRLSYRDGLRLIAAVELPSVFTATPALDVPIGRGGIASDLLRTGPASSGLLALGEASGLSATWSADTTWLLATHPDSSVEVTGSISHDPDDGWAGTVSVGSLQVGELLRIPDFTLVASRTNGRETWSYTSEAKEAVVQEVSFSFEGGTLVDGLVRLGDPMGLDNAPPVASWGGLIEVDGLSLGFGGHPGQWAVSGHLAGSTSSFEGEFTVTDGHLSAGELALTGLDLAGLATVDLTVMVVDDATYRVALATTDLGGDPVGGSGSLTFDAGVLREGSLTLDSVSLGALATIEDVGLSFRDPSSDGSGRAWDIDGSLVRHAGDPGSSTTVAGMLSYEHGEVQSASFVIEDLPLGFAAVTRFVLTYEATTSSGTTWAVSGDVRTPSLDGASTTASLDGALTLDDGVLVAGHLEVPYLPIAELAVIIDAELELEDRDGTTIFAGTGTVRAATEARATVATVEIELQRGAVTRAEVETGRLAFGGMVVLDDFSFSYQRVRDPRPCPMVDDPPADPAQTWMLAATRSHEGRTTAVAGCLVRRDGRTVAGGVALGHLHVGELFTIEDLTVAVSEGSLVPVTQTPPGGLPTTVTVPQATYTVEGSFRVGAGTPTAVSGQMVLFDGGVRSAHLDLGGIPLTDLVSVDRLRLTFDAGTPWDNTEDMTFTISGQASHDRGSSSLDGTVDLSRISGRIRAIDLRVQDLPFGPVTFDALGFTYDGMNLDEQSWAFTGSARTPDGSQGTLSGALVLDDGRILSGTLNVPHLSIGELALVEDATFTYQRTADRERWSGQGTVAWATGSSSAHLGVEIARDGRLVAGQVHIDQLGWGELFSFEDLHIDGAVFKDDKDVEHFGWDVSGALRIGEGSTSSVSGSLVLADGTAIEGELHLRDLTVADLVTIESLDLSVSPTDKGVGLAGSLALRVGDGPLVTSSGELDLSAGELLGARLDLGQLRLGEVATLDDVGLEYVYAGHWAAHATVTHQEGTTTLGGSLNFKNGVVDGGSLEIDDLQLGPLHLTSFVLLANTTAVDLDGSTVDVAGICGVDEAQGASGGRRWGLRAVARTGDGDATAVSGRMRLDGGSVIEGVMCVEDLQVADIVRIESATLAHSSVDGTDRWSGAATIANGAEAASPFGGSFAFAVSDRVLRSAQLTATGLNIGGMLRLTGVDLAFERGQDASSWQFSATLARQGEAPGTIGGTLQIEDGTIVGGALQVSSIPFGDAFTVNELELAFAGRRAQTVTPHSAWAVPFDLPGTPSCSSPPAPAPAEQPGNTGARESYFTLTASITANGTTFGARGAMAFADGALSAFDVSASCIPVGDIATIEDFRVAFTAGTSFRIGGRVHRADGGTAPGVQGSLSFDEGRVTGGAIRLTELSLGPVVLLNFNLDISAPTGASSTYAASFVVQADGSALGGSGSLTFTEGRLVAGSLSIPRIPLAGLVSIRNLSLTVDGSQPGRTELNGSATVDTANGTGSMSAGITFEDGRVTAGTFAANAVKVFDLIPVNGFGFSFDNATNRWSGQMSTTGGSSGLPSLRLGVEFANGKLVSGEFGFDGNGDGVIDGPVNGEAPASGDGMFGDIPLKALYIRYCATGSSAQFCATGSAGSWEGRIVIELPSEAAPGIKAGLRVRNGSLVRAEFELSGLNIPVFTGVMLNAIRGHVEADPWIAFGGGIGLTVGAPSLTVARVDANFAFGNGPGSPPAYKVFSLSGDVRIFPGNPLGININGRVDIEMQTWGYLGVSASIDAELIPKVIGVTGYASGEIFNASAAGVTITNPETGAPLTGAVVQIGGGVQARLLGLNVAGADFLINTIGAVGCAYIQIPLVGRVQIGAGFYWSGNVRLTCDMGRYRVVVPGTIASGGRAAPLPDGETPEGTARAGSPARDGRDIVTVPVYPAATVLDSFEIDDGERMLGIDVSSAGTPGVTVIAPDGTRYSAVDDDDLSDGVLITTGDHEKIYVFANPMAGTWQVEAQAGSPQIDEVGSYLELPPADVGGTVRPGADGAFYLDYDFADIDGQEVVFVERGTGSGATPEILGGIGTATRPGPGGGRTNGAGRMAAESAPRALGADGVSSLRATPSTPGSGTLEFQPNGGADGGEREIVALVIQDGLPRAEVVVDTYTAPAAGPASAPQALSVTEQPGGAHVSWQPPADDGGRRITSYRIKADTGMAVTVDHTTSSVDLPIPALSPGRVVPVTVQAWTGVGWGEEATLSFTATQTTPLAYLTYDEAVDPVDPVDPTDPVDPVEPVDPIDPTRPTDPTRPADPGAPEGPATPPAPPGSDQPDGVGPEGAAPGRASTGSVGDGSGGTSADPITESPLDRGAGRDDPEATTGSGARDGGEDRDQQAAVDPRRAGDRSTGGPGIVTIVVVALIVLSMAVAAMVAFRRWRRVPA